MGTLTLINQNIRHVHQKTTLSHSQKCPETQDSPPSASPTSKKSKPCRPPKKRRTSLNRPRSPSKPGKMCKRAPVSNPANATKLEKIDQAQGHQRGWHLLGRH